MLIRLTAEGLSGRLTAVDDPADPRLNAAKYLPSALASHVPLALVVLILGTNDAKKHLNRTAFDIATGLSILVDQVLNVVGMRAVRRRPRSSPGCTGRWPTFLDFGKALAPQVRGLLF